MPPWLEELVVCGREVIDGPTGKNDPVLGICGFCWPWEAGSGRDRSGLGMGKGPWGLVQNSA